MSHIKSKTALISVPFLLALSACGGSSESSLPAPDNTESVGAAPADSVASPTDTTSTDSDVPTNVTTPVQPDNAITDTSNGAVTATEDTPAEPDNTASSTDGETDNNNVSGNTLSIGSDRGLLSTATPQFQWDAVEGADAYQILMTEREGNQLTYTAETDMCAGTSCNATPTAAFHNNAITWQVDALSGGQIIQSSSVGSYETPRSFVLTPETSNEAVCEIWPSVSYDDIILLNNIWNNRSLTSDAWTQSISANQTSTGVTKPSWSYNWLSRTDGPESEVKAYPQIVYGNKLGTHVSADKSVTGLPEEASNIPELTIDFEYTEEFNGQVERNVALESFFHSSCNITGPCDFEDNRAFEMMVWVENPDEKKPGDLALTGVMIDDRLWDVYIKPNSNKEYIAFTAHEEFGGSGTLNWNRFVEWTMQWTAENHEALGIDQLSPELCMAAIEMGTELWWGEGSFTLEKFEVTRN